MGVHPNYSSRLLKLMSNVKMMTGMADSAIIAAEAWRKTELEAIAENHPNLASIQKSAARAAQQADETVAAANAVVDELENWFKDQRGNN